MSLPLLEVSSLTVCLKNKKKRIEILRNIFLKLSLGKTVALVGESGCGKTTLGFSIPKLLDSQLFEVEGSLLFEGKDLQTLSSRQMRDIRGKEIGLVFQDPTSCLNPVFTLGEQLVETAMIRMGLNEELAWGSSLRALESVGIADAKARMDSYPHELSGGMRQRVMIAIALLLEPKLLIADEPTTALDVTVQKEILELLRSLQKKKRMAILLITHDMGVVAEMADTVAVMYAGAIVEEGPVEKVFKSPAHPYTQALLKARLLLGKEKTTLYALTGFVPDPENLPSGCPFHPRCPYAFEKCSKEEPPDFSLPDKNASSFSRHIAKCWLLEKEDGA